MGTNAGRQGSKATHTRRATLLQGAAWRLTVPWRPLIRGLVLCLVLAGWLAPGHGGLAVAAAGTTRYVAPTGSDGGDCSVSTTPCLTIGYAVGQAQDGDTISVGAGTYAEHLDIEKNLTLVGAGASMALDARTGRLFVTNYGRGRCACWTRRAAGCCARSVWAGRRVAWPWTAFKKRYLCPEHVHDLLM